MRIRNTLLSLTGLVLLAPSTNAQDAFWKKETQAYYQKWVGVRAPQINFVGGAGQAVTPLKLEDHLGKRILLVSFDAGDFVNSGPPLSEVKQFVDHVNAVVDGADSKRFVAIGFTSGFLFVDVNGVVPEEFREARPETRFPIVHLSRRPTNDPYALLMRPGGIVIDQNGIIVAVCLHQMSRDEIAAAVKIPDWTGDTRPSPLVDPWDGKPPPKPLRKFQSLWKQAIATSPPLARTPNRSPIVALGHGDWYGDGHNRILVVDADGIMHVFDDAGKTKEQLKLPFRPRIASTVLKCVRLASGRMAAFQYPEGWPTNIPFVGRDGKFAFEYNAGPSRAIDSLAWADLDGNGCGEFIVGFNGQHGLEVTDCNNQPRWSDARLHNVWRVVGLGASKNQPGAVICSSADGTLRVYNADGELIRRHVQTDQRVYNFSAAEINDQGERQIMSQWNAVHGRPEFAAVCDMNGHLLWKYPVDFPDDARISHKFAAADLTGDATKEWIVANQNGEFIVLDSKGKLLAILKVPDSGSRIWTALDRPGKPGLLVTGNSTGIEAHELAE